MFIQFTRPVEVEISTWVDNDCDWVEFTTRQFEPGDIVEVEPTED
jgi:hypothetical protein